MPKQKTDDLLQLVRSLSRAEKRHFRLFVKRNQSSNDILFLQLFDHLDKYKEYNEPLLLQKIPEIKKSQLSNLKAHLYKQLLTSLRLLGKKQSEDMQLRESLDYARVLYNKGLYRQSLDILQKTKQRAVTGDFDTLALEALEFEKLIEGQYITRSIDGRAEQLTQETLRMADKIYRANQFSNLSLSMYGLYLRIGFVRNEKDFYLVRDFFHSRLPEIDYQKLDFWGKMYHCQAHFWFHHITQDFPQCYRYSRRWLELFQAKPKAIELHTPLYLKALHNLLNATYNTLQYERFDEAMDLLQDFALQYDMSKDKNIESLYYLYWYIHQVKQHFLRGTFSEGTKLVPMIMKVIKSEEYNWDQHRILVFYYRIACLYFGSGDNEKAIDFLNLIINQKNPDYREDIQSFARILNLIAHFEMGNRQLVEYQVKSVYRFLSKIEDLQEVQKEIFLFLRKTLRMHTHELREEFIQLKHKLEKIEAQPYSRRPFLYLDIISWLESKIEGIHVQEVIRRKFLTQTSG
ncbi:MAG: hypothetical protein D6772_08035 [Bacteroidetes bacterium]|nr:MAG: hypothetical protein D6772_08035 [Bacteroidota bacterium]